MIDSWLREYIMFRRHGELRPMMCCCPRRSYFTITMACMAQRGLMSFAEYMDGVVKRMSTKLWLAYELKDGKPVAVLMTKPSNEHIMIDTWEFIALVCDLPMVDRIIIRKDGGSETNITPNEKPDITVA